MIKELRGFEILDSRGRPTVMTKCVLSDGTIGSASVPSGASTGKAEALELRDGDASRYRGLGCLKAVANINNAIHSALIGKEFDNQEAFDNALIALDGTSDKHRLGANAILACSLAYARAKAKQEGVVLYKYFGRMTGNDDFQLPRPTINLFSGGKHAGGQIPVQDLLLVPVAAKTMDEALEQVHSVYLSASELIHEKYGMRALKADEGGLAPSFRNIDEMFEDAMKAIERAGLQPGKQMAMALDVASSHFYKEGKYDLGTEIRDSLGMIELIRSWVDAYPILSVEDGLAENDWEFWPHLKHTLQDKCLVLGDDLLCTQVARINRAVEEDAANALLLKVNQCGSLAEAAAALRAARNAGWQVTVSARSGETEDNWLADLATGWDGNQIKIGSIAQSDRLAKYNRMLELEQGDKLKIRDWIYPGN
ncbi:MAG: phosphopyruvate hydratase [Chitinophagaceae bacterium]|nr:phosphopyruvate hydratase [Chitinophagaceae bacterium]MCZ2395437.1 phosphopyruvate hydratase [Chitinophagales bacterium]